MKLRLEWQRLSTLKDGSEENLIYTLDLTKLPITPGVYIFGRLHGDSFEALYIGRANNLRSRIKTQLGNVRLMVPLKNAANGERVLLTGLFAPRTKQSADTCLPLIERALIRHYLSEGHDLVNIQGTKLGHHEVRSTGQHPKKFIPKLMFLEKTKGG